MRVLILDDDPVRHQVLALHLSRLFQRRGPLELGHAATLSQFVHRYTDAKRWDVVLLDYDLHLHQPEEFVGNQLANGAHAAGIIARDTLSHRPEAVIVHSLNRRGAAKMVRDLSRAGIRTYRKPFTDESLESWLGQ